MTFSHANRCRHRRINRLQCVRYNVSTLLPSCLLKRWFNNINNTNRLYIFFYRIFIATSQHRKKFKRRERERKKKTCGNQAKNRENNNTKWNYYFSCRNNSNQNADIYSKQKTTTEPIKRSANYDGGVCFVRVLFLLLLASCC